MADELGTRDVLEQVDTRLNNVELDIREMKSAMDTRFDRVDTRFDQVHLELIRLGEALRSEMVMHGRWQIGVMLSLFLAVIASIWLRP